MTKARHPLAVRLGEVWLKRKTATSEQLEAAIGLAPEKWRVPREQ
jgi:hypothetical protein